MRIGIDLRVLASGRRTGIEEYAIGLVEELLPLGRAHEWVLWYNAWSKPAFSFPWQRLPGVRVVETRWPNRALMASAAYAGFPRLDRFLGGLDLVFAPHFFPVAVSASAKLVVTFHDLSFLRHPEFFSAKKLWWHRLSAPQRQAERADCLITVSESSRQDLVRHYGVPHERIAVIYSGVASEFRVLAPEAPERQALVEKYQLPEHFILYFGTIEPRKNIAGLIQAFERLPAGGETPHLVIAGTAGWASEPIWRAWQASPRKNSIHFTGFIAPEDKPALYNLAEIFVYPSFFEGFGFPPLEAMACGVPVITSRNSSLPEVVGGAALFVDPHNGDELVWAMATLLGDAALRRDLARRGAERAERFSWRASALSTLRLFEKLV